MRPARPSRTLAPLLAVWLLAVQATFAWWAWVDTRDAGEWFMTSGGEEALSAATVWALSFADAVRRHPYLWVLVVAGFGWGAFRARHGSVYAAIALLGAVQLAGVAVAHQVVEDEKARIAARTRAAAPGEP